MTDENLNNDNKDPKDTIPQNKEKPDYTKLYESDEDFKNFVESKIQPVAKKNKELLEQFKPFQKKLEEDEILKAISEGKHEEVFSKIKESRDNEWKTILETRDNELNTTKQELDKYKNYMTQSRLKDEFMKVVETSNLRKSAISDTIDFMTKEFAVDSDGKIKHKEAKLNAEGKEYNMSDWLKDQSTKRSYLFEGKSGSGSETTQNYGGKDSGEVFTDEEMSKLPNHLFRIAQKNGRKKSSIKNLK